MKTNMKNISILLCVVAAAVSCYRKPIADECICEDTLSIPIDVDWETSEVTPQNVTVLIYNSQDGSLRYEHKYEHNNKEVQSHVYLPIGSYKAVVFNELRNQIDYVSCVGYENLSTLKFESHDDDPVRSRYASRSYVEQPGDLAVAVVNEIVVTKEMIVEASYAAELGEETKSLSEATRSTVESLLGVVPMKKSATIVIKAHVNNIFYARMPALVDLTNLADGYYVFGDKNSTTTSALQFTMNNRKFDDQSPQRDGMISATLTAFGSLEDRYSSSGHDDTTPIMLDLLFQLIDKDRTEVGLKMDVTDKIVYSKQNDGSVLMTIDVGFDEALPEVTPEGTTDSGFGSDLIDWGVVDIPLLFN